MSKQLTPIFDYLNNFLSLDMSRFFMPGHKGNHPHEILNQISQYDITEIAGADSLYEANGIIDESENIISAIYNSAKTCFCTGGSTLCIQTMLAIALKPKDTVIAARNSHIAFFNACALLDLNPYFVMPHYNDAYGVSGEITASQIESAIRAVPNAKAVYITSPDYLGAMSDIKSIAEICDKFHIPLLVDNAHGAHLKFLPTDLHPLSLGASMCCDSAHKTLPVFTGGAYLHMCKGSCLDITKEQMKQKMALFGSTSPSYLIMLSLDLCNSYLSNQAKDDFFILCENEKRIWQVLNEKGFHKISKLNDPTKITIDASDIGKTGDELAHYFRKMNIECEYAGERHIVFMLSPQNSRKDINRLIYGVEKLPNVCCGIHDLKGKIELALPKRMMSIREATFSDYEEKQVENIAKECRISAKTRIKCPPGVPIIAAGELIDEKSEKLLKKSSILSVDVIK